MLALPLSALLPVTFCSFLLCFSGSGGQWGSPALTSIFSCFRFENGSEFTAELEEGDDPAAYVTNLSYYHLVPFETDILD